MLNRFVIAILAVGCVLSGGCRKREESTINRQSVSAADSEARVVRVVGVMEKGVERSVAVNGVLAAHDRAGLSVKVAGPLEDIPVDVGSAVKKGDLIGQIQKRDWELRVAQARAAVSAARARVGLPLEGTSDAIELEEASLVKEAKANLEEQKKNRERIAKLNQEKILAVSELETAEAAYQVAVTKLEEALQETNNRKAVLAQRRADLNIAEQQLIDTAIRAPFEGVVQERKASPGEYLMEGAPLATLVRIDPIRLRLEVSEREAPAIRKGQKVRFRVDGDTNVFPGEIERMSPVITEDNRMLQIEADIRNDGRLRPGAFVRADVIVNENAPALLVPRSAVVTFAGIEKVFVVENGKAAERRVTTGVAHGEDVEILKGIKAGETVILEPGTMRNGQPVSVSTESTERTLRTNERPSG